MFIKERLLKYIIICREYFIILHKLLVLSDEFDQNDKRQTA